MTWYNIKACIQRDLNVTERRARKFTDDFRKVYTGYKEAIQTVNASYTDDGRIRIKCTINNKQKTYTI